MARKQQLLGGLALVVTAAAVAGTFTSRDPAELEKWPVHDMNRPQPPIVTPGEFSTQEKVGTAPSDAIVLFDGTDLSKWTGKEGEAKWKVENGYFEVVKGAGEIRTRDAFGDVQLHIEWASPAKVEGTSQGRGNSGVFFGQSYEVQVLDCYDNITYADGMTASLYGQWPPLVNACRKPGEWQVYDIVYRRPRFAEDGSVITPAKFTVFHNGVLVHDGSEPVGPTSHKQRPAYKKHPDKMPIRLQDHGNPVRFRNVWLRNLE